MKAKVYVTLKPSVRDPQGKAIKHSVELLGYQRISDIRQGNYFEIAADGSPYEVHARQGGQRVARERLSNAWGARCCRIPSLTFFAWRLKVEIWRHCFSGFELRSRCLSRGLETRGPAGGFHLAPRRRPFRL